MRSAASEGPDRRARAHARRAALSLLGLTLAACTDLPTDIDETSAGGCSVAGEIAVGQTRSGQLDHGDCPEGGGIVGDRWRLSLATDTTVRIDLTSDAFDAYLELRDASGVILASNDDWGSLDSRIVRTLAAGSYTIVARSLGPGGSGPYRLSVLDGASCVSLGGLEIGETVAGILEAGDCSSEWNAPAESWTLDLRQSRRLRIDLESADLDEVLLLRDPQGYEYWSSDWSHPVGHARIEAELPAGRWTVTATAAYEGARGSYELTVALPPACTPGTDFVLGETVSGALTPDDCTFDGWTPADSFGIVVTRETPVDVALKSADFEPLAILRDAWGRDVAFAYDTARTGTARARASLPPGTYALFVSGYPPEGSYALTVTEVTCEPTRPVELGQTVDGELDESDCTRAGGAFQESWTLVLDTEQAVGIDLTSAAFDAYLILKDASGNVIAEDDDGGSGLNAHLDRTLAAGTYEIVASSFSRGATGAYRLGVAAAGAATSPASTSPPPSTSKDSSPKPGPG